MRLRRKSDADAWRERIVQKIKAGTVCIRTVSIQHNGARLLHAVDDRDGVYASNGTKIPGIRADAYGTGVGGHCVPHRPSGFGYGVSDVKAAIDEAASMLQYIGRKPGILIKRVCPPIRPICFPSPINESQLISFLSASDNFSAQCMTMLLRTIESRAYLYLPAVRHLLIDFTMSVEKCCQKIGYGVDISELLGRNYIDQINQIAWEG